MYEYLKKSIAVAGLIFLPALLLFNCGSVKVETLYENGGVASTSPIAAEIGLKILEDGGNAVDAAVAVGFALAVCYPEAGNIGGGGFALVYSEDDKTVEALDFREKAPSAAGRDMYLDDSGLVIPGSSLLGAKAAGVPGTVAGMFELWRRYGTRDWYELLQPAIVLADTGFIVSDYIARSMAEQKDSLAIFHETGMIFHPDGRKLLSGDRFIQKDLSETLERIALDTLDGFYSGRTAELIAASMTKNGGLISLEDLQSYNPAWRTPIHFTFDSLDIYSMPPPSSGGVILGEILKILEPFDLALYGVGSAEYIHLTAEACRLAYADRAVHLCDPEFTENPITELLDSAYLESRCRLIDPHLAGNSSKIGSGLPEKAAESESTTHYCIADRFGNVVSLTYTLNTSFGSKLVVEGAGFLLNNEMDDFSIKPGVANVYGLVGGRSNEIAPGKRMLSSMTPTIVLYRGKPCLALGSPGGSKIITTVAQALIDFDRFGMNLQDIVTQPRFHHQWLPDTLFLETGGFDINIKQDLISRGHMIYERSRYGDLQIISINNDRLITGASDPRHEGVFRGY
nr:gamma-glutamyltransferase [candidate division Zixibacteria bacterium]